MKYSKSLDLIIASLNEASAGKFNTAALCFEKALKQGDLKATVAALSDLNGKAFEQAKQANPTLASMFAKIGDKQKAAKAPVTAKKGKKAEKAADDELGPVLDEMTSADDDGEEMDLGEFDDLSLDDLEGLDDESDEMPLAAASEDDTEESEDKDEEDASDDGDDKSDKDEEDAEDDGDDDEDDKDDDKEESKAQTASKKSRIKLVSANLDALSRLQQSVASKKKSAK